MFSCTQGEGKNEINWEKELYGFGNLKIEKENFVHLFFHFGKESKDFSLKGDTLLFSSSQLRAYLNYYSSITEGKDSLIRRPILWTLSAPIYKYKLKKMDSVIHLTNLIQDSDGPSEISLQMFVPVVPKYLDLLHLENQKKKDDVFHWDVAKGVYLYHQKTYWNGEDFESFKKLQIEKKTLNHREEKVLFSFLNLYKAHFNHPFKEIETSCGSSDYESVLTVVYKDSLYEYGRHAFPIPISLLMNGLTIDFKPNTPTQEPVLDTNDFLITDNYKHLPYARKRSESEKSNIALELELKALDNLKSNSK